MRLRIVIASAALVGMVACKKIKLDVLAFPSVEVNSYEFENYSEPELAVPKKFLDSIEYTQISFVSVDQETGESYLLYGVYYGDTSRIDQDTIIYYCHGQSRNMDYYWSRGALLANAGGKHHYGVFMIDYRGYGMSEGSSTEKGLIEDADAGLDWLIGRGLTEDRCIYYGYSLGAIPMIERAANRQEFQPRVLICESPLASVEYLTQSSTVINSDADFVTELEFNNAEMIRGVNIPYLWIHGIDDDYIKLENGEIIYSNYSGPAKMGVRVESAKHADIPEVYGFDAYLKLLTNFIHLH